MPAGPPPSPSRATIASPLVPVRLRAPTSSTVPAVAVSVSLLRGPAAPSAPFVPPSLPSLPALPCQPPSASFPPPWRSSSSILSVVSVRPQLETGRAGNDPAGTCLSMNSRGLISSRFVASFLPSRIDG
ncbi:hypothetical protein PUN28_006320 [Cardiocondyla obscurior]|uniref:Uncharacterized protein n=1 Tax=Cardiocondyla obscurior TaxID=286306 RepID=A0AAW2G9S2_9HYME